MDTAVTKVDVGPGWYTADLPATWNYFTPSGGVLMTVAMRAMRAELGDDDLKPLSATTVFCSPVPHGPLEVRVTVLRRSGGAAQLRAALSSTTAPGPGLEVTATFARTREGPAFVDVVMPDVPGPAEAPDFFEGRPPQRRPAFFQNMQTRLASGHRPWKEHWVPNGARFCRWVRYDRSQMYGGALDRLALPPLIDVMPPAVEERVGPMTDRIYAPSLDLTVHFLDDTSRDWLLLHGHSRRAGEGYAQADIEIWDDDRRLLAYGTQMMILRRMPKDAL